MNPLEEDILRFEQLYLDRGKEIDLLQRQLNDRAFLIHKLVRVLVLLDSSSDRCPSCGIAILHKADCPLFDAIEYARKEGYL